MNSNLHLYNASEENSLLQSAKFEWFFFCKITRLFGVSYERHKIWMIV